MRKLLLLTCLLLNITFEISGQAFEWAKIIDVNSPSNIWGAEPGPITSDGTNVISAGVILGTATFGTQIFTAVNSRSSYLAKYDYSGSLQWARHLIGARDIIKVKTDINHNVLISGFYANSLVIDTLVFQNTGNQPCLFLAKFSPTGALLWARNSISTTSNGDLDLTTDGAGNIYLASSYQTSFTFGNHSVSSLGNDDVFLAKFNPAGTIQWLNNIGNIQEDRSPSIVGGINNDIYITTSVSQGSNINVANGLSLKKFDTNGSQVWSKFIPKRFINFEGYITRDNSENIYLMGQLDSTTVFDHLTINYQLGAINNNFLAKISSGGSWQWANQIQTGGHEYTYPFSDKIGNQLSIAANSNYNSQQKTYSLKFYDIHTSGTMLKTISLDNLPYNEAGKYLGMYFFTEDNSGNKFLSGGVGGNINFGGITLQAPTAFLDPVSQRPIESATFIAKMMGNSNYVTGTLFIDNNGNGIKETGEVPYVNGIVKNTTTSSFSNSVANGMFGFYLLSGNSDLQVVQPANHYTYLPQTHTVTFTGLGQTQTKDFALVPIPNRNDVKISVINTTPARPGFPTKYRLTYENVGTTTLSDTISLLFDANHLTYFTASVNPASQQTGKLNWFYTGFQPTEKRDIDIDFTVSATTPINQNLNFLVTIKPIATDFIPTNNYDTLNQIVITSFDPNDKLVNSESLTPLQVSAGNKFLDYVIRFQNTGTDTAFTVVVRDSICDKLNMETFEVLSSSHPYSFRFTDNSMMEWRFDNILLPDSNRNEPASHGFIRYRIKPKTSLVLGDEIKARAGIYFDYNAPVMTNYAVTKIQNPTGIKEKNIGLTTFNLYPNPASDFVVVEAELKTEMPVTLKFTNLLGQQIFEKQYAKSGKIAQKLETGNLTKGVYLLSLQTEKGIVTKRLVIQ